MNRLCLTLLLASVAWHTPAAFGQDVKHGADGYKLCASCHGFRGEGNAKVHAPGLAGREAWYLTRQIENFRKGVRGSSPQDEPGHRMAQMTLGLDSAAEIADLVAYIGTLPVAKAAATVGGDVAKGKSLYGSCVACHGQHAGGNAALNAPALTGIDDWYQVAQLDKFRRGVRGASRNDTYGQQMAPMAAVLADEAAMKDVVAYINSLQTED
jgi:cytochrome c oxidase subunit 2